MRALKPLTYAGRFMSAGDVFELNDRSRDVDRHVLVLTQQAEDVENDNAPVSRKRGTYKRRDLRAEE